MGIQGSLEVEQAKRALYDVPLANNGKKHRVPLWFNMNGSALVRGSNVANVIGGGDMYVVELIQPLPKYEDFLFAMIGFSDGIYTWGPPGYTTSEPGMIVPGGIVEPYAEGALSVTINFNGVLETDIMDASITKRHVRLGYKPAI